MSASVQSTTESFPLTAAAVESLWQATIAYCDVSDEQVTIRSVSETEVRELNKQYRQHDQITNVLTFTYPADHDHPVEHDIALCLTVAKREAAERQQKLRDYTALLLVHAFLHAAGFDHERSSKEEARTSLAEAAIMISCGYPKINL